MVYFGGTEVVVRPSLSMPAHSDANRAVEFRVQAGTPGIWPNGEFEFTALKAREAPKKITLNLLDRCCGDQFYAKIGVNAAKVTLGFPASPWGKVEPATYPVDVMPKQKVRRQSPRAPSRIRPRGVPFLRSASRDTAAYHPRSLDHVSRRSGAWAVPVRDSTTRPQRLGGSGDRPLFPTGRGFPTNR